MTGQELFRCAAWASACFRANHATATPPAPALGRYFGGAQGVDPLHFSTIRFSLGNITRIVRRHSTFEILGQHPLN